MMKMPGNTNSKFVLESSEPIAQLSRVFSQGETLRERASEILNQTFRKIQN